jgi:hypothetical protein
LIGRTHGSRTNEEEGKEYECYKTDGKRELVVLHDDGDSA